MSGDQISRRALLRGAAAGTAVGAGALAYGSLPAWARTVASGQMVASERTALRKALSLPYPKLPAGKFVKSFTPEIEHVVVLMMENHSFDNLLGMVPQQVRGRTKVDGLTVKRGKVTNANPDSIAAPAGPQVRATHATSPCQASGRPNQDWNASHLSYNGGRNNGFVEACTDVAMWYWDRSDIPFTYSLVEHFPFGQRYFCSVLAQTYPNRRFLFCGTASGLTATNDLAFDVAAANGTIFNLLLQYGVSWKNYVEPTAGVAQASALIVPEFSRSPACVERIVDISEFYSDAAAGTLPQFSFIDPNYDTTSEENPQDIDLGEEFLSKIVHAVTHSPQWEKTALFITYDEHGGYYDHVPPPAAILPDAIAPQQSLNPEETLVPGTYNRYGFRVPLIVVSPWARANYVSSIVQDHTSITAFIEHKWNLPAMSARDANAHPLNDYFDFKAAAFKKPPKLAAAPALAPGLKACTAAGYTNPPGT